MKKKVILICVIIFLGVLVFNLNLLYADNTSFPKDKPKAQLAPNEVCVYTDAGFMGYELCWKHGGEGEYFDEGNNLPSEFVNTISSIRIGPEVVCLVFSNDYYKGERTLFYEDIENFTTGWRRKYIHWNDRIESLRIVSRGMTLKSPNMVCIFTDAGYVGNKKCYVIEPWQRYILLKHLTPAISSVRLSENVGCMLFEETYFSGYSLRIEKDKVYLDKVAKRKNWRAESLIVYRKEEGNPVGVQLFSRSWYKQFFPLPGDSIFYSLEPKWRKNILSVTFLGGKDQENLYADFYDTNGKVLTLSGNAEHYYDLKTLNWDNRVVVAIRLHTPPQVETALPKPSSEHDKATGTGYLANLLAKQYTNLSGTWNSNIGLVYKINQDGNKVSYQDPMMHIPVSGIVDGKIVTVSWKEGNKLKELRGTITAIQGENIAKTIKWANGVIFNKVEISPTVTATPSQPQKAEIAKGYMTVPAVKAQGAQQIDLSGTWNSNIGLVYQISQSGNTLSYQDPMMNKQVNGTLAGKTVTVSWMEGNAMKSIKGTITSLEGETIAKSITWANGVIFNRLANSPTVTATPKPPQQSGMTMAKGYVIAQKGGQPIDLSGTWNSNIGLVYKISQQGNKISYKDPSVKVLTTGYVYGKVEGKTVTVSWMEGNAMKSIKGTITSVDNNGIAKRIEWQNNVVFNR